MRENNMRERTMAIAGGADKKMFVLNRHTGISHFDSFMHAPFGLRATHRLPLNEHLLVLRRNSDHRGILNLNGSRSSSRLRLSQHNHHIGLHRCWYSVLRDTQNILNRFCEVHRINDVRYEIWWRSKHVFFTAMSCRCSAVVNIRT